MCTVGMSSDILILRACNNRFYLMDVDVRKEIVEAK